MRTLQMRRCFREVDVRAGDGVDMVRLSVSMHSGVVPRTGFEEKGQAADDLSNHKQCWAGDVVLNRMRAFQGALGIAPEHGIVSPDYAVLRSSAEVEARFLTYAMKSDWFVGQMTQRLRGIGSPSLGSVRTPRINVEDLGDIRLPVPALEQQRRIADFLDDQVARIDRIFEARSCQSAELERIVQRLCLDAISGANVVGPRRASGIDWVQDIPDSWLVVSVGAAYSVMLGKMLDESRFTGQHVLPYLRNTNVQWDRIDTSDLKTMDIAPGERGRFSVKPGDLLICEGGQPGRCAVWDGSIEEIGYQKALHRARARAGNHVGWLQNVLRSAVALDVFGGPTGQTTIGHLTGEQLREFKIPLPDPATQKLLVDEFADNRLQASAAVSAIEKSMALLAEYKRSLITAAVTGELDVTTARSGVAV